ncbi:hypothetical protein LINPERHAP1_LOCUS35734 [Linum perenne]
MLVVVLVSLMMILLLSAQPSFADDGEERSAAVRSRSKRGKHG